MKRSEIDALIEETLAWSGKLGVHLPPFALWTPEEWASKDHSYDEIRANMLGWDVTDYGRGDFHRLGLLLFTIRNGNLQKPQFGKPYAEKMLVSEVDQISPNHFHWNKMEDIINRGGGNLICKLYNCTPDGNGFADTDVTVSSDGRNYTVPAGTEIRLTPGESITLLPGQFHSFWGEPGCGKVMLTEVSKVNDDNVDNHFYKPAGRFPEVEEDEKPLHLLATDYKK